MELGLAYKFDWSVLWREPYGRWMLQGIWVTIQLGLISWVIALGLGTVVGTLQITPWRVLRAIGTLYVEIFRNIPFMVQLFFWYFAGPPIAGFVFGQQVEHWLNTMPHVQFYTAIFALGIYTASRIGEHIRSGFSSISRDQYHAALSTGLTRVQMYRYVIIPYAFRIIIPPLSTEFLTIFKNSAIAMTIGVLEATGMSYQINAYTFHGLEATTGASLVYLAIGLSVIKFMGWVESKYKIRGLIGR